MNKSIMLIAGVIISVCFVIFSTAIFESLYYESEFSLSMYENNLYVTVGLVSVGLAWAIAALYYYLINSVSFSRWYHWMVMLLATSVLSPIVNYVLCKNTFESDGYDFSSQLFNFSLRVFAVEIVLFVIVSFAMRWWSSNCRHTPIPE